MKHLNPAKENQLGKSDILHSKYQPQKTAHKNPTEQYNDKYESFFQILPIAISENDFTQVKRHFDSIKKSGVVDFKQYYKNQRDKRDLVLQLMKLVKIVNLNQAHYRLYGMLKEEHPLLLPYVMSTYSNELIEEYLNQFIALAHGKQCYEIEMPPHIAINGITKNIISHLQIAPGCEHDLSRVYISYIDITERTRANQTITKNEKALKEIIADKDRFIQILAHDLRSPFNAILGFSELLTNNIHEYDIEKIEKFVNLINDSANKTFQLLENILLWSRANSGKIAFEPQQLHFSTICQELIEHFKAIAKQKSITINLNSHNDIMVFADKEMLQTVLRNLISNAIKFTYHHGEINIYTTQNIAETTITIADNGMGMPAETTNNLFKENITPTATGTANEKGTGLGLMLCKEFISIHGGKIWTESEVGKGTNFKFTLPLEK